MRLTKIFLAAVVLLVCACKPDNGDERPAINWSNEGSIVGEWTLSQWSDNSEAKPRVYVAFHEDGNFDLYQQVYGVVWLHYDGTYTLSESILTGTYSDGEAWLHEYRVDYATTEGLMRLTSVSDSKDVSIYGGESIPSYIIEEAQQPANVRSVAIERFL